MHYKGGRYSGGGFLLLFFRFLLLFLSWYYCFFICTIVFGIFNKYLINSVLCLCFCLVEFVLEKIKKGLVELKKNLRWR